MEEFIYLHYTQPLTIDGLSAQCGMQRNHFITAFKRRFGETPYARIVRLRLAKAKVLLRGTDDTVRRISALCGFPSSTAFAMRSARIPAARRESSAICSRMRGYRGNHK